MIVPSLVAAVNIAQIIANITYDRPIIGIVAQKMEWVESNAPFSTFIAASYVKAVESSGARVVPIFLNGNGSYYNRILRSINGVVLPGGPDSNHRPGNPYYDAITQIYRIVNEMNQDNIKFPILSVDIGFEILLSVANNHKNSFLTLCDVRYDIDYENLPLDFIRARSQTALFADADENVLSILSTKNVTVHRHRWCALAASFENTSLEYDWLVSSLSRSVRNGFKFISTVEHKLFPYFGVQFLPQIAAFEWNKEKNFPHSREAVIANRYFFDTFVKFSRENINVFETEEEEKDSLIYNYNYQVVKGDARYDQIYLFK